jgi:MoaA/NifB/PqqE/SkfB family radical SAM enzyme
VFDRAPHRVYWEITRACGLACRHCRAAAIAARHPDELTTGESLGLIDQLAAFGDPPPHLILTGGDPFMRPDLFDLIAAVRRRGIEVSVAPSATPLLTDAAVQRLKDAGVTAISLSLDGATPETHDAIRQVPGTFERTLAAARAARTANLPFQVNTLVAAETLDELPAISLLAARIGAARWSLFFLVEVGRGTVLEQISPQACEELMGWLAELGHHVPPVVTTTEAPFYRRILAQRRAGRSGGHGAGIRDGNGILFIAHTGEIHPSGFLPVALGNVRTDDVVRVYREAELFRALRRPADFGGRCGRCEYHWQCGGSRARAFAATGDPLAEDPLCAYVPAHSGIS